MAPRRRIRASTPLSFSEAKASLDKVVEQAAEEGIPTALGGGFAMQAYGSTRLTSDVDVLAPKLPHVAEDGEPITIGGKSIVVDGVEVDVIVRDDEYADLYEEAIQKAKPKPGYSVKVITPEYLVAMKMVAGRPKDEMDLNFLLSSVKMDTKVLRDVISRFLGRYALAELASTIEMAKFLKKSGKL
jgi:hypothetical protein